jgi:hypothetical protein
MCDTGELRYGGACWPTTFGGPPPHTADRAADVRWFGVPDLGIVPYVIIRCCTIFWQAATIKKNKIK